MSANQSQNQSQQPGSDLPEGLSKPAQRALANAGLNSLAQLSGLSASEFKELHGIGPKAIELLSRALERKGLSFRGE
ncbi:helix-hairpin-helix domain-containing protein [Paenibacillus glycinis]|uniref:hypothetical protein n=1 Tax=Paenibacillus glycinis TaxID=2697035 RepID=UPI002E2B2E10|nr:hypothetical protein [Paenibacillus glycinis]